MSNFPLSYKLAWLPRLFWPSLGGGGFELAPASATFGNAGAGDIRKLVFLGDLSGVANREPPDCDPEILALLRAADLVVANCETPVVSPAPRTLAVRLGLTHAIEAGLFADILAALGLDADRLVLSLANNHVLDCGVDGFEATRTSLERLGIRTIGCIADGRTPVSQFMLGPLRIGLAAFTEYRNASAAAFAGRVAMLDMAAREDWRMIAQAADGVDLLCAVAHWDREFNHFPQQQTRRWAERLSARGAGLVVGHHAHVLQPLQRIGERLVAYGLGDFLGTTFARQRWPLRLTGMLEVDIVSDGAARGMIARYALHPVVRLRARRRERLLGLDALGGPLRSKVDRRLGRLFPELARGPA